MPGNADSGGGDGGQYRQVRREDDYEDLDNGNDDDDNETLSPTDGYFPPFNSSAAARRRHAGESYARVPPGDVDNSQHHFNQQQDVDSPPTYSPPSPSSSGYNTMGGSTALNSPVGEGAGGILGLMSEEQRHLLPRSGGHYMQLMSGGGEGYDSRRPWWAWPNLRRRLSTALGVLVVMSMLATIMDLTVGVSDDGPGDGRPGPLLPPSGDLLWPHGDKCRDVPRRMPKVTSRVEYTPGRNLTIVQDVRSGTGRQPLVGGELIFRPMPVDSPDSDGQGSATTGEIEVEMLTNYREASPDAATPVFTYDEDAQALVLSVPPASGWHWSPTPLLPCVQVRITVRVPVRALAVLDVLDVRLSHLDVHILSGMKLDTTVSSTITTTAGYVLAAAPAMTASGQQQGGDAYELGSRHIDISTTSGSVVGWYPLYDLLRIQSQSGRIDVRVGHKRAAPESPDTPATLQLATQSGSIAAVSVLGDAAAAAPLRHGGGPFPPREYVTDVQSNSGSISVELPFSTAAHFRSVNGRLDIALWPVVTPDMKPQLSTSSINGQISLILREPIWIGGDGVKSTSPTRLTRLRADHTSVSGAISLRYPSAWEGTVRSDTTSGRQSLRGEGLVVHRGGGLGEHFLEGRKGEHADDSFVSVRTVSGSSDFLIG